MICDDFFVSCQKVYCMNDSDDVFLCMKKLVKYVPGDSDYLWRRRSEKIIVLVISVMLEFFL